MKLPQDHEHEDERLKELDSYSILDTLPESDYDALTAIAAEICGTPISLISLVDDKRQWFKSHHGLDASETPKENAFCAHAINNDNKTFIVNDSRKDERFHDNPLVTDIPNVVFYAGVPLVSENGLPLGTLCVIDEKPKKLSSGQIKSLESLANQVMTILKLRKAKMKLQNAFDKLEEKNIALDRFAYVAAHDLKSPLSSINGLSKILSNKYGKQLDEEATKILQLIENSSLKLGNLIDGLLAYSRCENILKEEKTTIAVSSIKGDLLDYFSNVGKLNIELISKLKKIKTNKSALDQVFINLIANAIKYNDKEKIEIEIGISANKKQYEFYVKDNGSGIAQENQDKIFEIFKTAVAKDRYGKPGNGIGLATVKKVVEHSGGIVSVDSKVGEGSTFTFTLDK